MGFFDRFRRGPTTGGEGRSDAGERDLAKRAHQIARGLSRGRGDARAARQGHERELAGDLAGAVRCYDEAGLGDEAARVLLLRADAEASAEKRIAFAALAATRAESDEMKKRARARKALVAFDVLSSRGGARLKSEVAAVARELEEAGELERAADAYALAGDSDAEVRALTAAGAIERLEERLKATDTVARDRRDLDLVLRKLDDLDRTAERKSALALAREALARHQDERLADAMRRIRARLVRGPVVDIEIDGAAMRVALGDEITLGRDATIVVPSRSVSRTHVRVFRKDGVVLVEDLGTRNGTFLAGARLGAPLPVGEGVELDLGRDVRCTLRPRAGAGVVIEVAGACFEAPLGPLQVRDWCISQDGAGEDAFVALSTREGGERPFLGSFQLAPRVELCAGDAFASSRSGEPALRVLTQRSSETTSD